MLENSKFAVSKSNCVSDSIGLLQGSFIFFFKPFNDTYGHIAGDDCLRRVGAVLAKTLRRPADIAARYGGEEFACVLPETHHEGTLMVAEAMRAGIAALAIPHAGSTAAPHVTASFGVVTGRCIRWESPLRLMTLVDKQLYAAKAGGRNLVSAAIDVEK